MLKAKLMRDGECLRELNYPDSMGVEAVAKAAELVATAEGFNDDADVAIRVSGPSHLFREWAFERHGWAQGS